MVPVSVRGLCKSFDGRTRVLDAIGLNVNAGEIFFLLGASGCGKTTLLRSIAGFVKPDQGSIHFGEIDVTGMAPERRDAGMVFQQYALWPHLTVAENIAFGLDVRGVSREDKRRRVGESLDLVQLGGYGERRINELSGGQQQRVALARALVTEPRVLLLDEPLSNLDARLRAVMRSEIPRICRAKGATVIYVTHDQKEALSTADRLAVMDAGRIAQVGAPREIYERPHSRAVAALVGEGNFIPGTVVDAGSVDSLLGRLASAHVGALPPGTKIALCIRPEHIRFGQEKRNAFSAVIAGQSYQGDRAQWTLSCNGASLIANESVPLSRAAGESVSCWIDPSHVVALNA